MEDGRPGRPNSLPDINNIVSTIVNHPSFRETLNQILEVQTGISRTQNLTGTTATTSTTHSSQPTVSNNGVVRPGFSSPADEFRSVFNRGGSSLQRSAYHRGRSYSSGRSNTPYTARVALHHHQIPAIPQGAFVALGQQGLIEPDQHQVERLVEHLILSK